MDFHTWTQKLNDSNDPNSKAELALFDGQFPLWPLGLFLSILISHQASRPATSRILLFSFFLFPLLSILTPLPFLDGGSFAFALSLFLRILPALLCPVYQWDDRYPLYKFQIEFSRAGNVALHMYGSWNHADAEFKCC